MKHLVLCLKYAGLILLCFPAESQNIISLNLGPFYKSEKIALGESLSTPDSLTLHQLRFYLGHFTFYQNNAAILEDKNYHLFDLEEASTLNLTFNLPQNATFDSLAFNLGVDSLTTASGAMGGDLDPTQGMFWTWQSGYINVKMEGFSKKCPARNGEFQFHLGGYLPPYAANQRVELKTGGNSENLLLTLDLAPFFEQVNWVDKHNVMSPGAEAVRLSGILAKSFAIHAQ
ncbi:MAG TPA: hypothetical protein PLO67_10640 [Saprospiraceae bacterium]|nr:hypothetical protein [Saprospiraceae bacterium]HPI06581.1 hypothetical protein [Saprospiraceae bacterium]